MTYDHAMAYLDSLTNYERRHDPQAMRQLDLDRMRRLCRRLGDPQRRFRSVLVTGTNGKGSICAMLYAMLRESPMRVGLYTSPHVEHVRERIRVTSRAAADVGWPHGADWIGEEDFTALVEELQPRIEELRGQDDEPTYFETLTAVAFLYFSRRQVDIAVLEVGLGGRLDSTNVVEQAVSVIGPVDVDHADVLGEEPSAIAREKAGIIKPGRPVISAPQSDEVLAVLREICQAQGAPLYVCGQDLTVRIQDHGLEGLQLFVTGLRGIYEAVELPLRGRHQADNAAVAISALEALAPSGVPHTLVERGLRQVEWPGRIEVVHDAPLVLMDGGHNRQAAVALREMLLELCAGRPIHLLIGVSSDKPVEEIGRALGDLVVSITCTKSRHPRALDPEELSRRLFPFCHEIHVMADPADAYTYLLNAVSPKDAIVVTGSLFLVGELRAALRQAAARRREAQPPEPVNP